MKKTIFCIITCIFTLTWISEAYANENSIPAFDWDNYSYEEILTIKEDFDAAFNEKQRQWAIENGNRVIELDIPEFSLYTSKTQVITPTITRVTDDAPEKTSFVWNSSDETIAKVSSYGTVTAVAYGDAMITCTASDDEYIFAEAIVHVISPVTGITISQPDLTLLLSDDPNEKVATLSVAIEPTYAYCQTVKWESSNESIAVVDDAGNVTAVAPGSVTITATSLDEYSPYPKKVSSSVKVLQAVSNIQLDQTEITLGKNKYGSIKATVFPENASQKALIWKSSDPNVVTVSASGQLLASACGNATITCTAKDGSGISVSAKVTVIQLVSSVKINDVKYGEITLDKDKSSDLLTTVMPDDATNKGLRWLSSDSTIVNVDENGKITALNSGSASITAQAIDGSEKSTSVKVYVPSISIEADNVSVTEKSGITITVKFFGDKSAFSYTPNKNSNFSISDNWENDNTVRLMVLPNAAGKATLYIKDANNPKSNRTITITVEHSAAYDLTSYPRAAYNDALRYPEKYEGTNISIYGRVLQKMTDGDYVALRIGTAVYDYVFYVEYSQKEIELSILEDDYVTIFGSSTGTYTYEAVWGNLITLPSMVAEKIVMGSTY